MAQPRLRANFFVAPDGIVTPKYPPLTPRERKAIYLRDGGHCRQCRVSTRFGGNLVSPFEKLASGHIDHIFPRARGGSNRTANLRLLCQSCNAQKGAK